MYRYLDNINSPSDIRGLDLTQLAELCGEVRDYMVKCCAVNPGHVGSSLGSVELIAGLHYVYDTPKDKIVFDVGHQAYAHKILTGRREEFRGNRTRNGISGFPKLGESPYDAFGTGHSSTSVSAALGLAEAEKIKGTQHPPKIVALLGDGALTGGLAFEGLNNAGGDKGDILIILNDNNQSIDKNLGGIHNYLLRLTTSSTYNRIKNHVWNKIGEGRFRKLIQKITVDTKSNLVRKSGGALFEALGFRYFGPIDGNDITQVVTTLRRLRNLHGPRILHVHTVKGKGFQPAEKDPTVWHAPGRFNPETGERLAVSYKADRYQDVFGSVLTDLAGKHPAVVGVTPAMATGCGMTAFAATFPERFYDVGIEEEHAVTFSAGLAAGGLRPFCNIYSSFSQRAYDQIIHDAALQHLPVIFCFDRAGLVGEDGPTHQGAYDLAAYRSIPDVIISAPRNELELKNLMYSALSVEDRPMVIRYPRGCGEGTPWKDEPYSNIVPGTGARLADGKYIAIAGIGPVVNRAAEAAALLREETGTAVAVYDMRFLKPMDSGILEELSHMKAILTVEDGCLAGGLYGALCEHFAGGKDAPLIFGAGIPDRFIAQDSQKNQLAECGLDTVSILSRLRKIAEYTS